MDETCLLCDKRVLSHSLIMKCAHCLNSNHLCCLSITRSDSVFTNRESTIWFCTLCIYDSLPFTHLQDDDLFISALAESWIKPPQFTLERLKDIVFNPFELNEDSNNSSLLNSDPDGQYFQTLKGNIISQSSDYFNEYMFNNLCKKYDIKDDTLSFLHLNIRSCNKNFSRFEQYLKCLNVTFPFIGLTETWLTNNNHSLFGHDDYTVLSNHRTERCGGGVALLFKDNLTAFCVHLQTDDVNCVYAV